MSKFLKIPNGNYKIEVQTGGTITLDTGVDTGQVRITGDLFVEGNTTTIESINMTVNDNIIAVNQGETGAGVSLGEAGIRIDRGNLVDTYIVFDETIGWLNPDGDVTTTGAFIFKNHNDEIVGIRTTSITTGGQDLYLINSGSGVISVTGTTNYEQHITDDDDIPNKKYVDDAILSLGTQIEIPKITDGDASLSHVYVKDFETTGSASLIEMQVDGSVIAEFTSSNTQLHSLNITNSNQIIATLGSSNDITLTHKDTGAVVIDEILQINKLSNSVIAPASPGSGVRLYADSSSLGGTGIYFVNEEQIRDELVSKTKALLYGIIF